MGHLGEGTRIHADLVNSWTRGAVTSARVETRPAAPQARIG
jgi:hypothetical protein